METHNGTAHLRISYLGGGYDFPEFFATQRASILSEGIDIKISCAVNGRAPSFLQWDFPERLGSGLGSSAATALSMIRAKYPHASHRDQIDAAIHLERLQAGGWQDTIASGHTGIFLIRLFQNNWEVQHFDKKCLTQLKKYRKLYEIPNGDSTETDFDSQRDAASRGRHETDASTRSARHDGTQTPRFR